MYLSVTLCSKASHKCNPCCNDCTRPLSCICVGFIDKLYLSCKYYYKYIDIMLLVSSSTLFRCITLGIMSSSSQNSVSSSTKPLHYSRYYVI